MTVDCACLLTQEKKQTSLLEASSRETLSRLISRPFCWDVKAFSHSSTVSSKPLSPLHEKAQPLHQDRRLVYNPKPAAASPPHLSGMRENLQSGKGRSCSSHSKLILEFTGMELLCRVTERFCSEVCVFLVSP